MTVFAGDEKLATALLDRLAHHSTAQSDEESEDAATKRGDGLSTTAPIVNRQSVDRQSTIRRSAICNRQSAMTPDLKVGPTLFRPS